MALGHWTLWAPGCRHANAKPSHVLAQFGSDSLEYPPFEVLRPLLGGEHLALVVLEFICDVALGVLERLFSDVVGGDFVRAMLAD